MPARPLAMLAVACACLGLAPASRAEEAPTDALLKLLPADAGAVLAADDLRGRWADVVGSDLAGRIQAMPAFRGWLESPGVRDFVRARDHVLGLLQTSHGEIRDEILGDAVVLAVLPSRGPAGVASQPRGLLALKARKPELLRRLMDQVNAAQKQNGEVAEIVEAKRGDVGYSTRRYPEGSGRPSEVYALFPDGVFALSNSEEAVLELIDRKSGAGRGPSFVEADGFSEVAAALSGRPLARAFISAEVLRRAVEDLPPPTDAGGRVAAKAIRDRLGDLNQIGAALDFDGVKLQVRLLQAFKPDALKRPGGVAFTPVHPTGGRSGGPGPRMMALPETAVAAASFRIDAPAVYRSFVALIPKEDRPRAAKLETIADALLLGRSLRGEILPALGPRAVIYLDAPAASAPSPGNFPLPVVAAVEINQDGPAGVAAEAIENALRATLAALALDQKRVPATAQVATRDGVTALDVPYPFAFAIDRQGRRLAVGSSADSVAEYLHAGAKPNAGERFRAIQAAAYPDCDSFFAADLPALGALAERHKDRLAAAVARRDGRKPEDAARDLDRLLAAARLFDAAYLAARFDDATSVLEHRIGLTARPQPEPEAAAPAP
ncbi:hypothetical protein [Paludisphaera sp.]|uniref:hypothetical protein n=1 Tax=Paludisphaera sp. TaxID=2017432 RepID=UPI00301C09BC